MGMFSSVHMAMVVVLLAAVVVGAEVLTLALLFGLV